MKRTAFVVGALLAAALAYSQIFVSQDPTGTLVTVPSLSVGMNGTTRIRQMNSGTSSLDYGVIGATSKVCTTAVVVTGAALGDIAVITLQSALNDDIVFSETIVGADTISQCAYNPTAGGIDPAAVPFDWLWIDVTP